MYRERAAGMYNELPFALAQCVIELPYNLLQVRVLLGLSVVLGYSSELYAVLLPIISHNLVR